MNTTNKRKALKQTTSQVRTYAVIGVIATALVGWAGPAYYGISVIEKIAAAMKGVTRLGHTDDRPRPGDEWLNEKQDTLDVERLLQQRWVGIEWQEEGGNGRLCLDPTDIQSDNGSALVNVQGLPNGPLELHLLSEGKHTYRGPPYCGDHSGLLTEEEAVLIRLPDNRLRLVVQFTLPHFKDIDAVFKRAY